MVTTVVNADAGEWTLVASGPGVFEVELRNLGSVKLRVATSEPVGQPSVTSSYVALSNNQVRQFSLAASENLYVWSNSDFRLGVASVLDPSDIGGENHLGEVGGAAIVASASFNRPADTNAYAIGDLIADSTTAATVNANVTPATAGIMVLTVARVNDKTGRIPRLRLKTNDAAFAAATVRVHLFKDRPTVTNGDNGAWLATESNHLGYADVVVGSHFSDAEKGIGAPAVGTEFIFEPATGTRKIYALLEARSVVTPGSGKTWTLAAEVIQN